MIYPNTPQSTASVALHYDELDAFYREIWGEHVHHGYWKTGRETPVQAVNALVDLLEEQLELTAGMQVCDIGCGYGATARRLAGRHAVNVVGVTVSHAQASFAARCEAETSGAPGRTRVVLSDWLVNRFATASFDRAYSIESSEHMADKQRFFDEAFRVLRPHGKLVVFVWLACSRPSGWEVRHLLEPICREGRLPGMGDEADYRQLAGSAGFKVESVTDLSQRVRRTWSLCAQRILRKLMVDPRYRQYLFDPKAKNRVFALTLLRLLVAYRTGSMRYAMMTFGKAIG